MTPSEIVLDKYANLLVNFGLGKCKGIKKGDTVLIAINEYAKPLLQHLQYHVLKAGGNPIIFFEPDGLERPFFEAASEDQLGYFPEAFYKGLIDQIDHRILICGESNPNELAGIAPDKITRQQEAYAPVMKWRNKKEDAGKFTWTIGLYPSKAMADDVGMTLESYWDEVIKACYLDSDDPIARWCSTYREIEGVCGRLNSLGMRKLRVLGNHTNFTFEMDKNRKWRNGVGFNIPSYEIYTSPNWRTFEGHVYLNQKLNYMGNIIQGVSLKFQNGIIVESDAEVGADYLAQMIKQEGANKFGEFSLTDSRHSRITKYMGEILFDENVGGPYGNMHLAVGDSYRDCYTGDPATLTEADLDTMGYNYSGEHQDIVSTEDRAVEAILEDGHIISVYRDGEFKI